uniref:Peptidase M12B domain-containing protein n=1 Tax=Schistosoma mansoni TaxID=6183 RepID=A0A5K4F784_SCHMA
MVLTLTHNCIHLEYLRRDLKTFQHPFYSNDQFINLSQPCNMIEFCINPVKMVGYFQLGYSHNTCKTTNIDNATIWNSTQYLISQNNYFNNSNYDCNNFYDYFIKNEQFSPHYDTEIDSQFKQRIITHNQQMKTLKSLMYQVCQPFEHPDKYYNKISPDKSINISIENNQEQQTLHIHTYHQAERADTASHMMLTSHLSKHQLKQFRDNHDKHSRIQKTNRKQTIRNRTASSYNNISNYIMNVYGHRQSVRMDQKSIFVIDHSSSSTVSAPTTIYRSVTSIHHVPHALANELSANNEANKDNQQNNNPILSFQYVEPHTVELLVVVTETMKQKFGLFIDEYLLSTMTTVSTLLRHPSLKNSIQLNVVDIILLDPVYARRHNLEDWSNSKQEQVMARFCKWVNRLRTPTYTWDSAILLNVGHFKSTALGVAHYRSMCNRESSCLAVLDRGFGTGHIIAHELGHQLGAKHDFELNSSCGLEEQDHHMADPPTRSSAHDLKLGTYPYYQSGDEWDYREDYRNSDVHQYEFVRRDTIMSGTLYFDQFPLRWSACSRQAIHLFIESNGANCLRYLNSETTFYSAEKLAHHSMDNRPGQIFSLNKQCEFVLKINGTQFCGQMLPPCRQLYCQDSEHRSCLPMETAWAEGTPCGSSKWCIQGRCVSTNENPTPLHGNWGEWGSWSKCSRSCGGGVQFSERECNNPEPQNGGNFCHGTRTRMRSCGNEPCEKQLNIRQTLCDKIDGQYKGQLRAYFPKLGEPTSCNLVCLYNSHSVSHGFSLPDGTPCYALRDDICIQGKCWETGCDGILGSRLRFDRCRVCGGDNSTCEEIKGVFNGNTLTPPGTYPRGLMTAVRIPKGVTNAFVRKVSDRNTPYSSDSYDDFMLLIFEELKTQIRRGETHEPFAGAELYYSGSRSREEIVSITGRLNKDVNIVIRVENSHTTQSLPRVEYSYFIDKSQKNNSLYFIAESEARLAEDRINRRTGRSQNILSSYKTVDELIHPVQNNPNELDNRKIKNEKPQIYFVWRISELPTGCTTCAGNVTTPAECYPLVPKDSERSQFSQFDLLRPVADYLCASMPKPPSVFRRCSDYCGVRWSAKPMQTGKTSNGIYKFYTSSCSARCNEGHEAVEYVCEEYIVPAEQKDKSKGIWRVAQLGELVCHKAGLGKAPSQPAYVTCKGSCHPVYWILSNWTECNNSCGDGTRKRILYCQDEIGQNWPLNECMNYGESMIHHSKAPKQSITIHSAQEIILLYQQNNNFQVSFEHNLYIEQYNDCFSLSKCRNDINWSTTRWSECEPLDEQMKSNCRLVDNITDRKDLINKIIGVRYRNVSCIIENNDNYHNSLNKYIVTDQLTSGYFMRRIQLNLNFCRKASMLGELMEEPYGREACTQPKCYRWGNGQMSACSVNCGRGVKQTRISCECIILKDDLDTSSNEKNIVLQGIHIVDNDKCMQNLQYMPRLFTDKTNGTIFVETVERRIDNDQEMIPLKVDNINEPVMLTCIEAPCDLRVPAWRTTSWSACSSSCGLGVRQRKVMCVVETQNANLHKRHSISYTSIFTTSRFNIEVVDSQICHNALLPMPTEQETCLEAPCPMWQAEDWQECIGECEYGIQHRKIRCIIELTSSQQINNHLQKSEDDSSLRLSINHLDSSLIRRSRSVNIMDVDQERCRNAGAKPISERPCLINLSCPYWYKSEWSKCSVNCGMGIRSRQVACRSSNGTVINVETINDNQTFYHNIESSHVNSLQYTIQTIKKSITTKRKCLGPRPIDKISCGTRPCTGLEVFWWPVASSECNITGCELAKRERIIKCLSPRRGPVHDTACNHLEKPLNWTICESFKCKRFEWRTGSWSQCPDTCVSRMKYRQVKCVDDLGNEYSETLCPANLKPSNRGVCPNLCSDIPKSCRELKYRYPSADDGTYQLLIEQSLVYIYCADMESSNPSEYITLRQINYAASSEFLQPYPDLNWCPPVNQNASMFNISKNMYQPNSNLDSSKDIPESFLTSMEVNNVNCPSCPTVSSLVSKTFYNKVRLDIYSLEVKINDGRFSHTLGSSMMPYGTAKDCFSSTVCPQGKFQIDLRGTSFKVSVKTRWTSNQITNGVSHIHRLQDSQLIYGRCGGHCTGCWPQPGLFLELKPD